MFSYPGSCRTKATNGNCCVFPFIYKRRRYYSCTKRNAARKWCATTPNYDRDRLWSYCRGVSGMYKKKYFVNSKLIVDSGWPQSFAVVPFKLLPSDCSRPVSMMVFFEITKLSVNEVTPLLVVLGKTDLDLRSYFHVSYHFSQDGDYFESFMSSVFFCFCFFVGRPIRVTHYLRGRLYQNV